MSFSALLTCLVPESLIKDTRITFTSTYHPVSNWIDGSNGRQNLPVNMLNNPKELVLAESPIRLKGSVELKSDLEDHITHVNALRWTIFSVGFRNMSVECMVSFERQCAHLDLMKGWSVDETEYSIIFNNKK